jgi:carbonic anhydrase
MEKLVRGVQRFHDSVYRPDKDMYRKLADKQSPHTMFVTCSDSRVYPETLTQSGPGQIFVLRNAGNLVPPYGAPHGGEAATVEYAVDGLAVQNIVVCGHSNCGAMKALLEPGSLAKLPMTAEWLRFAECTRHVVRQKHAANKAFKELWLKTVEENVLVQLDHLRTHPSVAAALAAGRLKMYGWVFDIYHGEVLNFDPHQNSFVSLHDDDVDATDVRPAFPVFQHAPSVGNGKPGRIARAGARRSRN